jgi:putative copper export protein/methionine-rich copper-binding protein CopC/mono/diheme cytochrome c family protein
MRRGVCCLVLVLAAWSFFPQSAFAHVELLGSEPPAGASLEQPPAEIRLYFSEPVAPGLTDVSILDSRGRRLDRASTRIDPESGRIVSAEVPDLSPGVYTVAYRALSAIDGHIDRGVVAFAVGTAESAPGQTATEMLRQPDLWTSALLRWFSYLSALLMLGLSTFRILVVARSGGTGVSARPSSTGTAPRGRAETPVPPDRAEPPGGGALSRARLDAQQRMTVDLTLARVLSVSAIVLVVASVAQLIQQAFDLADDRSVGALFAALENLFVRTRYGAIWLARMTLGVAVVSLIRTQHSLPESERSQRWGGTAILAGLALYTIATLSHSASALDSSWIGLSLSWAHLVSVAVWFGGAVALTISARLGALGALAARFSRVAVVAFAASVLSGFGQTLVLVGDLRAAVDTLPGQLLLAKITVVVGIAVFAWRARRLVGAPSANGSSEGIDRNARREVRLGALALAVTAVLVYLPPAWQTYQQQLRTRPIEVQSVTADLTWTVRIDPGRPGDNVITLHPPAELRGNIASARLLATYQDDDLPPSGARFEPTDSDILTTRGSALSVAGRWLLESVVRLDGGEDVLVRTPVELAGPGTPVPPPPILGGGALTASVLVALMLVGLGLGLLVFVVRTLGTRTGEARGLIAATVAIMLLGGYVAVRPAPSQAVTNLDLRRSASPIPPSEVSVARGREVYAQACAECHGASGSGDGPRATERGERLTDLRLHLSAGHTDGDLYYWITNGIRGTDMPAFGGALAEDDRWHVVNAIRAIAAEPST